MKRAFFVLLICISLIVTASCSEPLDTTISTQPTEDTSNVVSIPSDTLETTVNDNVDTSCKLIVKGRDITSENYVYVDGEHKNVEIPLTAVMKELGAEVQWQDETTIIMTFNGNDFVLDTEKQAFGLPLPPGSTHFARKVIGNEVVVDIESAKGLITHWIGAEIVINYDEKIVEIG